MTLARRNRQIPLVFTIPSANAQRDVRYGFYPTLFSENIFVAMIALLFMVVWSGAKMTGTET